MLYFCRSCNYLSLTVCGVAAVTARSRRRNGWEKTEGRVRRSSLGPVKNLSTELVDCRPVLYCLELEFTNAGARVGSITQPARFTWLLFPSPRILSIFYLAGNMLFGLRLSYSAVFFIMPLPHRAGH